VVGLIADDRAAKRARAHVMHAGRFVVPGAGRRAPQPALKRRDGLPRSGWLNCWRRMRTHDTLPDARQQWRHLRYGRAGDGPGNMTREDIFSVAMVIARAT
jgi:hypothetical protein